MSEAQQLQDAALSAAGPETMDGFDNRLLVIGEIGCGPPHMGNRARMRSLLRECRDMGLEVHFAGVKFSTEEREATLPCVDRWVADFGMQPTSRWSRLASRVRRHWPFGSVESAAAEAADSVDQWMRPHWVGEARRLQRRGRYRRVLVAYVFHSAFFEAFGSDCLKILDTHDVFANRRERLQGAGVTDYWFTTTEDEEARGLRRADVVLAIQEAEAGYFRRILGGSRQVEVVGHFVPTVEPRAETSSLFPPVIGFLASANPLNVDALRWFLVEVWPTVMAEQPHARLKVGGRIGGMFPALPASVELCGSVDDVDEFYAGCLCTMNPMRSGTGLKIKTLESLAHGCPVVATSVGAEGLDACCGRGLVVADDGRSMAACLIGWLAEPGEARKLGDGALRCVQELTDDWRANLRRSLQPQLLVN